MPQEVKTSWDVGAIGEVAGQVWQQLKRSGKSTLSALDKQIQAPSPLTCLAIGWLAREGKIAIKSSSKSVQVWLTE